jgi:hypothetical protein
MAYYFIPVEEKVSVGAYTSRPGVRHFSHNQSWMVVKHPCERKIRRGFPPVKRRNDVNVVRYIIYTSLNKIENSHLECSNSLTWRIKEPVDPALRPGI